MLSRCFQLNFLASQSATSHIRLFQEPSATRHRSPTRQSIRQSIITAISLTLFAHVAREDSCGRVYDYGKTHALPASNRQRLRNALVALCLAKHRTGH